MNMEGKNPSKYAQDYNKNDTNYEGEKSYKGFVDEITLFTAWKLKNPWTQAPLIPQRRLLPPQEVNYLHGNQNKQWVLP